MSDIRIIIGDCRDKLKEIPSNSVKLVVTSPPYNIGKPYGKYKDKLPLNEWEELINDVDSAEPGTEKSWAEVENMIIRQPIEAQKDEKYVVLMKKVAKNETETETTYDVKFLVSYREQEEEKIPGRTETIIVQETAKLPITGDSVVLFVILGVIVVALIIVFIRMKKLKEKESGK